MLLDNFRILGHPRDTAVRRPVRRLLVVEGDVDMRVVRDLLKLV